MQTIIHYRCDTCETVHENSCNIFKCKICGEEICEDCADDNSCMDYCERKGVINMSLVSKNKMLNEQLEKADKSIIALMNKVSELESKVCKLEQDNEYLQQSVALRECNLKVKCDLRLQEIEHLQHKLKQCEIISNNVLYFDDSSDYSTALWQVLNITQDRNQYDACYDVKLAYMEDE